MPAKSTFPCPVCGENVPAKAKACPHCGACDKTGWKEGATDLDGLDLPDDSFDYDKFTEEEFGTPRKKTGWERLVWITALVLLILTVLLTGYNWLFN